MDPESQHKTSDDAQLACLKHINFLLLSEFFQLTYAHINMSQTWLCRVDLGFHVEKGSKHGRDPVKPEVHLYLENVILFMSELSGFVDIISFAWKTHCNTFSTGIWGTYFQKNDPHVIVSFVSSSISARLSTPLALTAKSKQSLVIWLLPFRVCVFITVQNRLTLSLISWRTQHATHIAAGSISVWYTWTYLHCSAKRGRCTRGTLWSWPVNLTGVQVEVKPYSACFKLNCDQKQH